MRHREGLSWQLVLLKHRQNANLCHVPLLRVICFVPVITQRGAPYLYPNHRARHFDLVK